MHVPDFWQYQINSEQNTYVITINVTNKQKAMYYHEYVPELLDVRHLDPAVWYES